MASRGKLCWAFVLLPLAGCGDLLGADFGRPRSPAAGAFAEGAPLDAPPDGGVASPRDDAKAADGRVDVTIEPPVLDDAGAPRGRLLVAGDYHTCAIDGAGALRCWGANVSGQIGNGTMGARLGPSTVPITDAVGLAAGVARTCALHASGKVSCWGKNTAGALGDGTSVNRSSPTPVVGISDAVAVTTGDAHTCVLRSGGRAYCFGLNADGAIGDNSASDRLVPTEVAGGHTFVAIEAGAAHTCALDTSGGVWCWGGNGVGQLGTGDLTKRTVPTRVVSLANVTAISSTAFHTCALLATNEVRCWGLNDFGQLGSGSHDNASTPVALVRGSSMEAMSGVLEVRAGGYFTCARRANDVRCVGSGTWGELGRETLVDDVFPDAVKGAGSTVTAIAAGYFHACMRRTNGAVECWGANDDWQVVPRAIGVTCTADPNYVTDCTATPLPSL